MSEKSERLFRALSDIDEKTIDEAAEAAPAKKKHRWKRWTALAAALALVVGAGSYLLPRMGGSSGGAGAGGSGSDGASTFMSYAGPVFPLTLKEGNAAITAERDITLDFQPWVKVWWSNGEEAASRDWLTPEEQQEVLEQYNEWYPEGGRWQSSSDILVTDSYTLTNSSGTDQTVSVLYPFVSSLNDLASDMPTLYADGQELETTLHAGSYSGGFMGAWGGTLFTEENPGSVNLDQLESWEEYKVLLSDGSYLERALGDYPDLTGLPVVVYKFTDAWGPEEDDGAGMPNPSIRVTFNLDYSKTVVLSYGFHSGSFDREKGFMGQGFSIREERDRNFGQPYYLIVLGEDVQNMEYKGYVTGGWDDDPEVEAGVTITRYEIDLDAVLRETTELAYQDFLENRAGEDGVVLADFEMYYGLLCDQLLSYGVLAQDPAERYDAGWLEDSDIENVDRVFYLEAEITVPDDREIKFTAAAVKGGSYDFYCAHTENQGVMGYDLVTELGSNLACPDQTATLEDHGQIRIVRQNFGFDLENGVKTVALDPEQEHYYLEVKRAEDTK